jgi:hypothetical protein
LRVGGLRDIRRKVGVAVLKRIKNFSFHAEDEGSWKVEEIDGGKFKMMPKQKDSGGEDGQEDRSPLLGTRR